MTSVMIIAFVILLGGVWVQDDGLTNVFEYDQKVSWRLWYAGLRI